MARGIAVLSFALLLSACGGNSPTAPSASNSLSNSQTPTAAPPAAPTATVTDPPRLACPNPITLVSSSGGGGVVIYAAPSVQGGEGTVRVSCTPASGSSFPIGSTSVECKATDALDRSASCVFPVTLFAPTRLSQTKFLAFGDSMTAGEISSVTATASGLLMKQVVVPSASYPAVLFQSLRARYRSQFDDLYVFNDGQGAEWAQLALPRFVESLRLDHPGVVLLMEGANDICCNYGIDGVHAAERGIADMAGEARLRGARVFIGTLPPSKAGPRGNNAALIAAFNTDLRAVATSAGAVLVDVYSTLLPDVEQNIGPDGLHPSEAGYRRIADAFFAAIQQDLEIR